MEPINRLILAAVCITCGAVIGVAALVSFGYYGLGVDRNGSAEVVEAGPSAERDDLGDTGFTRGAHIEQIYVQRAQIKRLQSLLDQKTALLEKKTLLLDEKTSEQSTLQKELDEAIDMLEMLAAEVFARSTDSSAQGQGARPLRTEVERLRTDSEKSRAVTERQQAELDLLMMELNATDEEIVQLERESELELSALIAEKEAFEGVVSGAFAQLGEQAVPILAGYLVHPQPGVRRWAATTLGEIGPLARDAVPPLIEAGRDSEPEVRDAARGALAKIDKPDG
jgi:HEAT repeat protein